MDYDDSPPEAIAAAIADEIGRVTDYLPVETDGARRAAQRIATLLTDRIATRGGHTRRPSAQELPIGHRRRDVPVRLRDAERVIQLERTAARGCLLRSAARDGA